MNRAANGGAVDIPLGYIKADDADPGRHGLSGSRLSVVLSTDYSDGARPGETRTRRGGPATPRF